MKQLHDMLFLWNIHSIIYSIVVGEEGRDIIDNYKIYIRLFGTPSIWIDGQIAVIKRRKSRALVYYLAAIGKPVSRIEIVKILWPQFDRTTALKNLSTYVHNIRSEFPELIVVEKNYISISKEVVVDAHELEKYTLQQNFNIRNNGSVDKLYCAPFLEHFSQADSYEYEQWKREQSEYYLNQVINYKYFVANSLMEQGENHQALKILNHILKLDPYREDVYKLAMKASCKIGNRPGAVKLFEQLNDLLKEEMGISPMSDTIQMYSELITEDIMSYKEVEETKEKRKEIEKAEQSTIMDIIPKLSGTAKMLLQLLSMCEKKFDFKIMSSVLGIQEEEMFLVLDELRVNRAVSIGMDNSIVFLSLEEKDYVYSSISSPQRKYLHFRIAKAIEETYDLTYERAQNILYHYQRSGENYLVLNAAMMVGRMADARGDIHTAIQCYEQACGYLGGRDRMELIEYMSQLLLIRGDGIASMELLRENAAIAGNSYQLGIESCFHLQAQLSGMQEYKEVIWGGIRPQYPIKLQDEMALHLMMGECYLQNDEENLNFYIMFLHCKSSCLEMQMKFQEARDCFEKVLQLVMRNTNPWFENYVSNCYLKMGMYEEKPEKAEEYLSMGVAHTAAKRNWSILPFLLAASSEYDIWSGRIEKAQKNLEWAESLDKKYMNPYAKQAIMFKKSQLAFAQGKDEEGVDILYDLLESTISTNSRYMMSAVCKQLLEHKSAETCWPRCQKLLKEVTKR